MSQPVCYVCGAILQVVSLIGIDWIETSPSPMVKDAGKAYRCPACKEFRGKL